MTRSLRRPLAFVSCLFALSAASFVSASAADASSRLRVGIFDDAQTLGNTDGAFREYSNLRVQVVRINLRWDLVAKGKPAVATNPAASAYVWTGYDRAVKAANTAGIQVFMTIFGSPRWANGGRSPQYAPNTLALRKFAIAAARRYSGAFPDPSGPSGATLPRVKDWGAWNEPNLSTFLRPQFRRVRGRWVSTAPKIYARICNAVWNGVHSAQSTLRGERVACGLTSPRGNDRPRSSSPSHSPLHFLRRMKAARAKFDVYAHHPYSRKNPPARNPRTAQVITLGNIHLLIRELTRRYGRKRLWITEYGYQTNPPDRSLGVPNWKQARYLRQAHAIARRNRRIDLFTWFLLRDEPDRNGGARGVPGWQSGFYRAAGDTRKSAYGAFRNLPR